ncbi:GntP family permease [Robiginitalea sp. M366]|uniref:GntP family permease n=1 Tax=Robiginitalea aestuariiviva TaxID=3036903 RepID=UPI00240E822F|nr:GntP family permease [Robiginitalea aestuariiviva]MDG1571080.1 GntP family permease [Robiginitalea aestuariiviva]
MYIFILVLLCIAFIVWAGARLQWHPLLALLTASFLFGLLSGMPLSTLIDTLNTGFGETIGKIGLLIILGIIIGTFLEKSGGAMVIAEKVLGWIGRKRIYAALGIMGYIVSIPVYADSGFMILHPLARALSRKAKASYIGAGIALALGLTASHTMVPPTPGPIAAAGIMEADLGLVLLFGLAASAAGLTGCILFARSLRHLPDPEGAAPAPVPIESTYKPGALKAFLPILAPILLILLGALAALPGHPLGTGWAYTAATNAGHPVAALGAGLLLALLLPKKWERQMLHSSGWVGEALHNAAIIILITGAGGAFGKVLQEAGIGTLIEEQFGTTALGIWLPFLVAAALKSAQGSSTVALITTASIIAPLQGALGFDTPLAQAMAVVAIGAGSAVVSHANDSFFWVVTQLLGLDTARGYRTHTMGTAILGLSAMICLSLLYLFIS